MRYTKAQERVIGNSRDNLQVIACAGSGKTEVISARIVRILRDEPEAAPRNIVAFTYTDRAAAELKERVTRLHRRAFGSTEGLADMYVGTIHGFCLAMLQTYCFRYLKYSVLNEVQARLFVDRYSNKSGLTLLSDHRGKSLERYKHSRLYLDILGCVREADVDWGFLSGHPVEAALASYQSLLDQHAYLDFSKIISDAVTELASTAQLREAMEERVRYLVVDEYQDVNPLQERLIHQLQALGANLCVVGDDDQTIYQWRGSDVENMIHFAERYPSVRTQALEQNFRSSEGVVEAARGVIELNDPDRLPKTMVSVKNHTFEPGDLLSLSFQTPDEEGEWIASKIRRLLGHPWRDHPDEKPRGLSWSDFSVLLRSVRNNAAPILAALDRAGIPYVVGGMNALFDQPEVQAAAAIFHYMMDGISRSNLLSSWREADLGIGTDALALAVKQLGQERKWDPEARWATYNLQRTYLRFLETCGLREENVPDGRGEIAFFNLGKFSQVISDFEQIHFQSDPQRKYAEFAGFLTHRAPTAYPEGWQDAGYARPDAVQVMTVHQAKGMEWPVVFVPCMIRNRFPSKAQGGLGKWHVIPREAIEGADRYDGSPEDERRLFYVAATRSQRFLFCSWAPIHGNQLYQRESQFLSEFRAWEGVLTREPRQPALKPLKPTQRDKEVSVTVSFSELKYILQCPYGFKLRFLYGFNPPLHEALGYGKSLHDALAEVHRRAQAGDIVGLGEVDALLDEHLHVPFAYPELRANLRKSAGRAISRYLEQHSAILDRIIHVEQPIEVEVGDGVLVSGRIDLIRRTDTNQTSIVDFKSSERAQAEDVSQDQLYVYALGYRQLTGRSADLIEIHNLDRGVTEREVVDDGILDQTARAVARAGKCLKDNELSQTPRANADCGKCDYAGICRRDSV